MICSRVTIHIRVFANVPGSLFVIRPYLSNVPESLFEIRMFANCSSVTICHQDIFQMFQDNCVPTGY